jgi:hypothetical protein
VGAIARKEPCGSRLVPDIECIGRRQRPRTFRRSQLESAVGMTPSAHKRHEFEQQRLAWQDRERLDGSRLARGAARHAHGASERSARCGWRTIFYPTMDTAVTTGCHWLHVLCPACQQLGEVDLRKMGYHPKASLAAVVRKMSCRRCCPHPPFALPLGATADLGMALRGGRRDQTSLQNCLRSQPIRPITSALERST